MIGITTILNTSSKRKSPKVQYFVYNTKNGDIYGKYATFETAKLIKRKITGRNMK